MGCKDMGCEDMECEDMALLGAAKGLKLPAVELMPPPMELAGGAPNGLCALPKDAGGAGGPACEPCGAGGNEDDEDGKDAGRGDD